MNSNRDDEEQGLSPDELMALLTGKCPHEIQLHRAMAVVGALVARQGGRMELDADELLVLGGRALRIETSPRTGKIELELMDAPAPEQKLPTHTAPSTRQ